jgi:hypothetical protein
MSTAARINFALQFDRSEIIKLVTRYEFKEYTAVQAAGKRIAAGEYARSHLETIYEWKTKGRGRSRIARNTDEEIADALKLVSHARTDRAAVAVLMGLRGVDVPVASAILTAINPSRFTIIDFRALAALGVTSIVPTIDIFISYCEFCRNLAMECNLSLRDLDRALWQWSKDQSRSN